MPVSERIQFKIAIQTFKTLHTNQPAYLNDVLVPYIPSRNLRSAGGNLLVMPRIDSVFQSRAFSYAAPRIWNSLPVALRGLADLSPSWTGSDSFMSSQPSVPMASFSLFKSQLKTHLFSASAILAT